MKVIVVKEEGSNNPRGRQTYVGVPYATESAAHMAVVDDFYATHYVRNEHHSMQVYYFENETQLRFVSEETGKSSVTTSSSSLFSKIS